MFRLERSTLQGGRSTAGQTVYREVRAPPPTDLFWHAPPCSMLCGGGEIHHPVEPLDLLRAVGRGAALACAPQREMGAARLADILIVGLTLCSRIRKSER